MITKKILLLLLAQGVWAATPSAPSALTLSPSQTSVTLHWQDNSSDETGFKIYRGGKLVAVTEADTTSYTDLGLTPETYYEYVIKATNAKLGLWERTNPGGGGAFSMIGSTAWGTLVAGSDLSGVYRSFDKGKHWEPLGEVNGLMNSAVVSLGFHPSNGDTFYVGTTNGLYKTINRGETFVPLTAIPNAGNGVHIESISIPRDGLVYVTFHSWDTNTSSQLGILTNNDSTYTALPLPENSNKLRIVKLFTHPLNDYNLYALTGKPRVGCSEPRAYVTENNGTSWTSILVPDEDILDIAVDPAKIGAMYVSTFTASPCPDLEVNADTDMMGKFYKVNYKTGTVQHKVIKAGDDRSGIITVNANGANTVGVVDIISLATAAWTDRATFTWKGANKGDVWSPLGTVAQVEVGHTKAPSYAYESTVYGLSKTITQDAFNPKNIYGTFGFMGASFDGGATFQSLSTKEVGVGTDKWRSTGLDNINGHCLDVNGANGDIIYMGGYDIGLWYSNDQGASWQRRIPNPSDGSNEHYIWGLKSATQPAGTNISTLLSDPADASKVWASFGRAQFQAKASVVAGKEEYCGLFNSADSGISWSRKDIAALPEKSYRIYGLSLDKSTPVGNRTLYMTVDGDIYKSSDDGETWGLISVPSANHGLKFTAVANELGRTIVYAGGESGLWRSISNGAFVQVGDENMTSKYTSIRKDLIPTYHEEDNAGNIILHRWSGVSSIVVDPQHPTWVYVTVLRADTHGGLYRSKQSGDAGSWKQLYANPNMRNVAIHPQDSNIAFVTASKAYDSGANGATATGVQYTENIHANQIVWEDANDGMAWKFAGTIKISKGANPHVWMWSPGTGVQHAPLK